jgi:hypothetical protein
MRRLIVLQISAIIIVVTALPPLSAQAPSAQVRGVDSYPTPASIQEAEAEGAAFAREPAPPSLPSGFGDVKGTDVRFQTGQCCRRTQWRTAAGQANSPSVDRSSRA